MFRSGFAQFVSTVLRASPDAVQLALRLVESQGRQHVRSYAVTFLCMMTAAGCTAASAYLLGRVVNEAYLSKDVKAVAAVCLAILAVSSLKGIAAYWQSILLAKIQNRVIAENQERLFQKLITQPISFFSNRHSSEFSAAIHHGPVAAAATLNVLVTSFGRDLLSVVCLFIVMVTQAPFLSLIAFVILPPAVISVRKIVKRSRIIARAQYEGDANILQTLQETLQGYKVVKTFNLEQEMITRIGRTTSLIEKARNDFARVSNRSGPLMESLGGIAVSLVLMYAGYHVLVLDHPPGQIVSFVTAFLLAYEPAKRLARVSIELNASTIGLEALYKILDAPSEPDDSEKPKFKPLQGAIEFKNVRFSYRSGETVLNDISFVAEPKRVTALVGPSGEGKTTVLNLILRLYDGYGGAILVDGQEIREFNRASLRATIAYVGQETFLFPGSIRDNIERGKPGATDAEIVSAAQSAYADGFISRLPNGYDTLVGENGLQLSGGQRQRIAIARALIRDAKIILLDEPTAALDGEAEHSVRAALSHLLKDRTTIIIAHGLHTVAHADKIYVIEGGRVVEEGKHAPLLTTPSRYRTLFELQQSAVLVKREGG